MATRALTEERGLKSSGQVIGGALRMYALVGAWPTIGRSHRALRKGATHRDGRHVVPRCLERREFEFVNIRREGAPKVRLAKPVPHDVNERHSELLGCRSVCCVHWVSYTWPYSHAHSCGTGLDARQRIVHHPERAASSW